MTDPKTPRDEGSRRGRGSAAQRRARTGKDLREQHLRWSKAFLEARTHVQDDDHLSGLPQAAVAASFARLYANDTNRRLAREYARLKPALQCAINAAGNIADLVAGLPHAKLTRGTASEPTPKVFDPPPTPSNRDSPSPTELVDILEAALRETEGTLKFLEEAKVSGFPIDVQQPEPATLALEELDRLGIRGGARLIEDLNLEDGLTRFELRDRVKKRRKRRR